MNANSEIISENVLESMPVGLLVIDSTGAIATVNPAAEDILGYVRSELLGKGWGQIFFQNEDNYLFNQVFVDVVQKEIVGLRREAPYSAPNGRNLRLSVISSYLQTGEELIGIAVILHDITEIHEMQQREKESLEEKSRIQEDKILCLNNLAASVAHQIRNPALAIGGFATRLAALLGKRGIESSYPEIILEEAGKLERIVKAMARFNALAEARLEEANLRIVLEASAASVDKRARERGKTIEWRRRLPDISVQADPRLLTQAFEEILFNAVDHISRPEIVIELAAQELDGRVEVTVTDSGDGIPEKERPHIFDPFFSSKPSGVGIGLTLAQEIILEHDGDVYLDRNHSPGTRIVAVIAKHPRHGFTRSSRRVWSDSPGSSLHSEPEAAA